MTGSGGQGTKHKVLPGRAGGALLLVALTLFSTFADRAAARDAAFLDPQSAAGAGAGEDAIKVEPKSEIDIGDSVLGVARRLDIFFVNQSGVPVKVDKMSVNGDGNVATEIASDDCSKQVSIPPGSRCSVEVSVTPSSPGAWSAEILMTHDGIGRIARAKLTGKTAGQLSGEKKDMGLALNTKESNPVNFGDVDVGFGKTVRSALMVNDSAEPITLYAIDVIEASNGLTRLEQGCAVDMELKPGESCPVTLVWKPSAPGQISTDLIIRHSGRLGFAVIPIRGTTKTGVAGSSTMAASETGHENRSSGERSRNDGIPPPPGANEVAKAAAGRIPSVAAEALSTAATATSGTSSPGAFYLIGTVGNRAVILKPDGKTAITNAGDELEYDDKTAKVIAVNAKSVELLVNGKKKTLPLTSAPDLVAGAAKSQKKDSKAAASAASDTLAGPVAASGAPPGGNSAMGAGLGK
ncbi:MAG: hypothetical protein M3N08_00760 [Pseudomonadota bacterium]|nr:hypothetical protein [Pseudomonadota bacterium]